MFWTGKNPNGDPEHEHQISRPRHERPIHTKKRKIARERCEGSPFQGPCREAAPVILVGMGISIPVIVSEWMRSLSEMIHEPLSLLQTFFLMPPPLSHHQTRTVMYFPEENLHVLLDSNHPTIRMLSVPCHRDRGARGRSDEKDGVFSSNEKKFQTMTARMMVTFWRGRFPPL